MRINNKYQLEDLVYLVHDFVEGEPPRKRMITAITVGIGLVVTYSLQCGTECTEHFEAEITDSKPVI